MRLPDYNDLFDTYESEQESMNDASKKKSIQWERADMELLWMWWGESCCKRSNKQNSENVWPLY